MSYLIGTFKRDYYEFADSKNPMSLGGIIDEITKDHLIRASKDEDYQVINLITREYYDPKQNAWIKIQNF